MLGKLHFIFTPKWDAWDAVIHSAVTDSFGKQVGCNRGRGVGISNP